jgi:hypothetical protein
MCVQKWKHYKNSSLAELKACVSNAAVTSPQYETTPVNSQAELDSALM